MRDFVRIFHSQMSTRISSEMDKCKQVLRDIREERNISKQGGALLLNNIKTNPIYSDSSEGCDSVVAQRPLVFKSAKSIEELNKHNTFVNIAALNSSGENLSLESDSDNCTKWSNFVLGYTKNSIIQWRQSSDQLMDKMVLMLLW